MDLEELSAFLRVVEAGSFLSAADSLGVSRTTLRRRVAALEARAGVTLLESTPHGVVLTEAGAVLQKRGRVMIEEASALITSVRDVGKEPAGILRCVLPVGLPPHLVTPWVTILRQRYPRLGLSFRCSDDPLNEPLVDVDVVLHLGDDAPRGPFLSHVVLRVREWLVASKAYLDRRGVPRSIDELRAHELFAWQAPFEDARIWPTLQGTSFEVAPALVASDIHLIRHCCIDGLGIGLVPDIMIPDPGVPKDTLVSVLPELVGRDRFVRVTVPEALSDVPKIKMILDFTRGFLRAL